MTLSVENLKKSYGGRPVVNGVSFNIKPGEVVGLLGPNGAGKTTSFYAVVGIIQPDAGDVVLDGPLPRGEAFPTAAKDSEPCAKIFLEK